MSAADLMAVLVDGYLRYDFDSPNCSPTTASIFSKGHASTLLLDYPAAGAIPDDGSCRTARSEASSKGTRRLFFRGSTSRLIKQGLPIGVGTALAAKYLDRAPACTWVLCGDSEMAEALDVGGLRARQALLARQPDRDPRRQPVVMGETMVGRDLDVYVERARAFGW